MKRLKTTKTLGLMHRETLGLIFHEYDVITSETRIVTQDCYPSYVALIISRLINLAQLTLSFQLLSFFVTV